MVSSVLAASWLWTRTPMVMSDRRGRTELQLAILVATREHRPEVSSRVEGACRSSNVTGWRRIRSSKLVGCEPQKSHEGV
jgi:hypothetical protein